MIYLNKDIINNDIGTYHI